MTEGKGKEGKKETERKEGTDRNRDRREGEGKERDPRDWEAFVLRLWGLPGSLNYTEQA